MKRTFYHPKTKRLHYADFYIPHYKDELVRFFKARHIKVNGMSIGALRSKYIELTLNKIGREV